MISHIAEFAKLLCLETQQTSVTILWPGTATCYVQQFVHSLHTKLCNSLCPATCEHHMYIGHMVLQKHIL